MAERFLGGRVARVTGGASGQERACALALAEAGADVAVGSYPATRRPKPELEDTYYPAAAGLDAVCAEIEPRGVRAMGPHKFVCRYRDGRAEVLAVRPG